MSLEGVGPRSPDPESDFVKNRCSPFSREVSRPDTMEHGGVQAKSLTKKHLHVSFRQIVDMRAHACMRAGEKIQVRGSKNPTGQVRVHRRWKKDSCEITPRLFETVEKRVVRTGTHFHKNEVKHERFYDHSRETRRYRIESSTPFLSEL